MLKITTTVECKEFSFCKGVDFKLRGACRIDWGDGIITLIENWDQAHHKYKKKGSYEITLNNLDTNYITFNENKDISKIEGILPTLTNGVLRGFFNGCVNLEYIDKDLFTLNEHQENLEQLCYGVSKIRNIEFLLPLKKAKNINYMLYLCYGLSSIDILAEHEWGKEVTEADYAFSHIYYMNSPRKDILEPMTKLKTAIGIFKANERMHACYPYFTNNLELEWIDEAFRKCSINQIDENWIYYLPLSVKTNRNNIFDVNVKINGINY